MISKFLKLSQAPPPPMPPPAGGMGMPPPPMGGGMMPPSPMGGMPPMGMSPAPTQPMSSPPDRMEITSGLESLGKILYDSDVTELIENHVGDSIDDISQKVWEMYGGDEIEKADESKIGTRGEEPLQPPASDIERKRTDSSRWERLPKGKIITDITSYDELQKVMTGLAMGTVKKTVQETAAAGGAGGGMAPPMMANRVIQNIRLANILDYFGYIYDADYVDVLNM
jgi:hypothetical protein